MPEINFEVLAELLARALEQCPLCKAPLADCVCVEPDEFNCGGGFECRHCQEEGCCIC